MSESEQDPTWLVLKKAALELFKKGLAYRQKAPVNWCPHCRTVVANEEVTGGEGFEYYTGGFIRKAAVFLNKISGRVREASEVAPAAERE